MRRFRFHNGLYGSAMTVHVTPRGRKNELAGILPDGTLKVRLTAPPVEGAANKALLELLAKVLGVRVNALEIIGGEKGRDKIVSIVDLDAPTVEERVRKHLKENKSQEETGSWPFDRMWDPALMRCPTNPVLVSSTTVRKLTVPGMGCIMPAVSTRFSDSRRIGNDALGVTQTGFKSGAASGGETSTPQ